LKVTHRNPKEFKKWYLLRGTDDRAAIARKLSFLRAHGLDLGLPTIRRINLLLWELRIPSGLRLYFVVGPDEAIFLKYGNKDSQRRDIDVGTDRAKRLHSGD
jgi:hypothetical protein